MPTPHPTLPPPPQPTKIYFDPFNSSATGHQTAPSRLAGTLSWRESRTYKLAFQFKDTTGGGGRQHLTDLVGAGSEHYGKDGRKENGDWEIGAPGLRENGWQDIRGLMGGNRKRKSDSEDVPNTAKRRYGYGDLLNDPSQERSDKSVAISIAKSASKMTEAAERRSSDTQTDPGAAPEAEPATPQIFWSLVLYLNGSTAPLISDHRLKQLWVQHGGSVSIALGRRTVTHVVLGDNGHGGGSLASTKIQKEIKRIGGKGVKYVNARWVLDCVERGKRLSESPYSVVEGKVGGAGQGSVRGMFGVKQGR